MWTGKCSHEDAVRRMAGESLEDATLIAHTASCPSCRDTFDVAVAMRELAAQPASEPERPTSAAYLWWKAELLRKLDAEQRAMEPVEMGERFGAGVAVIGVAAIVALFLRKGGSLSFPSFPGAEQFSMLPWLAAGVLVCALGATAIAVLGISGSNRRD